MSPNNRPVSVISSQASLAEIMDALIHALDPSGPAITICSPALPAPTLRAPKEISLVVATSGSTGDSKYVALTRDALWLSANATHQYLQAQPGERWALRLPLTHIAGIMVLARSLCLDSIPAVPIMGRLDRKADFEAIVPTQLHRALTADEELLRELQNARAVLVGGAKLSDDLLTRARASGINVVTTYGMSETSGGCVYNNEPLAGVEFRITDKSLIELKGPMLATGYLDQDGKVQTSPAFHDGWFTTSDLGEIMNGNQLHVLGRTDDVIITGGENVSLDEVEKIIRTYPGILDALCAGTPDEEWGERIIVGVVADSPITLDEIREFVGRKIDRFAAPRAIVRLDQIPLRGIGKPDRGALSMMQSDEEI